MIAPSFGIDLDGNVTSFQKAVPTERQKREKGTGFDVGYGLTWRGCEWHPLIAPSQNLRKALAAGPSLSIAEDLHPGPAFFEVAIAPKDQPTKRLEVYLEATENLRDSVKDLLNMNGKYRGFFDHALGANHCIWLRYRTTSSFENAQRETEKIFGKYDYAWNSQNYGSARTLTMKERQFCGCCCRTGYDIIEGPPKFTKNESSFKKLMGRK